MVTDDRSVARLAAGTRRLADRARGVPPLVLDAVLAISCYFTIVIDAVVDGRLKWWVVVLAAANTVPLLWRRRFPLLVTAIVGIGTAGLDLAYQLIDIPAAQLVATYTFAALSPPLQRMIGVVGTVIGVTASITVPGDELLNLAPNAIMFLVAYALGTSARARRTRIEMLEERARRLAEEQDAAAARERQRIAREMHDILAHSMSLVVVQAEAGPVAARNDPDKAEEMFDTISATARGAPAGARGSRRDRLPDRAGVADQHGQARRRTPGLGPPRVAGRRAQGGGTRRRARPGRRPRAGRTRPARHARAGLGRRRRADLRSRSGRRGLPGRGQPTLTVRRGRPAADPCPHRRRPGAGARRLRHDPGRPAGHHGDRRGRGRGGVDPGCAGDQPRSGADGHPDAERRRHRGDHGDLPRHPGEGPGADHVRPRRVRLRRVARGGERVPAQGHAPRRTGRGGTGGRRR